MVVDGPGAEFQSVYELGFQQHRDQHLPQSRGVAGEFDRTAQQLDVFGELFFGRWATQHAVELFLHGGRHFGPRRDVGACEDLGKHRIRLRQRTRPPAVLGVGERDGLVAAEQACQQDLAVGEPLRVAEHDQQVAAVQCVEVVVADAGVIRQQERVGDPDEAAVLLVLAVAPRQAEHIHDALVKDLRADQPTARQRVGLLRGGPRAARREQLFVVDQVAVVRVAQFVGSIRSARCLDLGVEPLAEFDAFLLARLWLVGRRHLLQLHHFSRHAE